MKQLSQNMRSGQLRIEDVPAPVVQPGRVLVQTAFSLISAGTERSLVETGRKSLLGKAIASVVGKKEEKAVASLFTAGGTHAHKGEFAGSNDFEVVAFLVVLPEVN